MTWTSQSTDSILGCGKVNITVYYYKDFRTLFKTFSRKKLRRYVAISVSQRISSEKFRSSVGQFCLKYCQYGPYCLRSLGERDDMDITIDGFHSWMWKGEYYSLLL